MTVKSTLAGAVLVACAVGASPALADIIFPVSTYEMRNGDGQAQFGTYNYWDATYSGSGPKTTDGTDQSDVVDRRQGCFDRRDKGELRLWISRRLQ